MDISYVIRLLLIWSASIFVSINFYKSGAKKIVEIYSFYTTMYEYKIFKEGVMAKFLISLLVTSDLAIALLILLPNYKIFASFLGIIIQLFYIILMVKNYDRSFENNCNCFKLNMPKKVDFKAIIKSIAFLFIFICLIILIRV